jgi:Zn-dependent M28 family amino/carboxypeptidase
MTGGDKSDLTDIARRALTAQGLVETPEVHAERGSYYRSDHFSFAKRGVPMLDMARGNDLFEGGVTAGEAQSQDYTDNRYHQPSDQYSPDWNWDGILEDVGLYYTVGRDLADGTAWPNWRQGDEFRAVRDKSCAASAGGC